MSKFDMMSKHVNLDYLKQRLKARKIAQASAKCLTRNKQKSFGKYLDTVKSKIENMNELFSPNDVKKPNIQKNNEQVPNHLISKFHS